MHIRPLVEEELMIAEGRLRGEKVSYEDGIGYCVWYPFTDKGGNVVDEDAGMCFDFPHEDINDLIALLEALKVSDARDVT